MSSYTNCRTSYAGTVASSTVVTMPRPPSATTAPANSGLPRSSRASPPSAVTISSAITEAGQALVGVSGAVRPRGARPGDRDMRQRPEIPQGAAGRLQLLRQVAVAHPAGDPDGGPVRGDLDHRRQAGRGDEDPGGVGDPVERMTAAQRADPVAAADDVLKFPDAGRRAQLAAAEHHVPGPVGWLCAHHFTTIVVFTHPGTTRRGGPARLAAADGQRSYLVGRAARYAHPAANIAVQYAGPTGSLNARVPAGLPTSNPSGTYGEALVTG